MPLRFRLPPGGDVPPATAARRLGLSPEAFREALPALLGRGFPPADPVTSNYDLDAIDAWRRTRHPSLFGLTATTSARDVSRQVSERVARLRGG